MIMIMFISVAGLESNVANLTRQFVERAKNQANYHDHVGDYHVCNNFDDEDEDTICGKK